MTMMFRYGGRDDAGALTALIESAYRSPETAGRWDSESHLLTGPRTSRKEILSLLEDPDARFIVAGDMWGCALIRAEATGATFGLFAIALAMRGRGLGRSVLAQAECAARDLWNADFMRLTAISLRTELIAWYARCGYAPTGRRLPFPFSASTGETRRDFDLMEMEKRLTAP
jgi:GNAT superfamily N-acetyltransferase